MSQPTHVVCGHCDSVVRLPSDRLGDAPRCPKCHSALFDGKPIALEYCQMCHKLTNLTKAHKDLDDWKDTIHTMIDRGSDIPDDKIDILAAYLAKNFGPKDAAPASFA